jgi:hypothetical protein
MAIDTGRSRKMECTHTTLDVPRYYDLCRRHPQLGSNLFYFGDDERVPDFAGAAERGVCLEEQVVLLRPLR